MLLSLSVAITMNAIGERVRRVKLGVAFAAAVSAFGALPVATAGAEIAGYRRLVELESSRVFSSEITYDLQQRDTALAARAALAAGRTKDLRALQPLERAARHAHDPAVRAMAIYGVGLLADVMRVDIPVIAFALHDPASVVRAAAVNAASRAVAAHRPGSLALAAPLVAMMRADADAIVRARASTALAAFADTTAATRVGAAVMTAFGHERNPVVRWHEAWTLGRAFPLAPTYAQIGAGLADRDELVRIGFLTVAGRSKNAAVASLIDPLLSDPSWRVAEQARESLNRLHGGDRTQHLTAIPAGVITPEPVALETSVPLPRPIVPPPLRRPRASDALLDIPLMPETAAALDGPLPGPHPRVRILTTKGAIVVRLYPEWAPLTVANFLRLVNRGYYDGERWFRIVPDFVVQTGDPQNDNDAEPPYTIPAEENPLEQRAGVLSMGLDYKGNDAIRDSAGTQFYLTMSPQLHLNRAFTVFGEIESGFSVLGRLIESDKMLKLDQLRDD